MRLKGEIIGKLRRKRFWFGMRGMGGVRVGGGVDGGGAGLAGLVRWAGRGWGRKGRLSQAIPDSAAVDLDVSSTLRASAFPTVVASVHLLSPVGKVLQCALACIPALRP